MLISKKLLLLAFLFLLFWLSLVSCKRAVDSGLVRGEEVITTQVSRNSLTELSDDFETRDDGWKDYVGDWQFIDGVLKQLSVVDRFPVILREDQKYSNLDLSVKFKPVSGRIDASGGLIFRAKDENNYYIVRANALENNFRLYKFADGRRYQLASAKVAAPEIAVFHSIRIVAVGNRIQAFLDDKLELDFEDDTFDSGYVGLWTKADSVTVFDDLELKTPE